ncbi:phBC6A51 family helix-turn-helix protein, partial [Klebsiella pneumoniae]|uniref:phBC6A51 family helix-turn-helix protein n=3 Tax=Bacteria TaxID=2 RepID=UPI002731D993
MSKTGTKPNEYRPTKAEKKLLETLVNPDNIGLNVEDLCAVAKISKNTYYVAMKKPEFVKLVNETTLELVKGKVSDVLNAS